MGATILKDVLIIFLFSIPAVVVAHRLKIPSIVGFLITGILIGPYALRLIPSTDNINVLAEIGVALLLFSIGIEFSFDRLRGWGKQIAVMGTIQVAATMGLGVLCGHLFGFNLRESVFLSSAAALSSTVIVLAILSHRRWFDAPSGRIATGILILQDLAVIPIMVFLKFISTPHEGLLAQEIFFSVAKFLGLIAALLILSKWILKPLLHFISKPLSKELFVVVIVGVAIGSAYVTEKAGMSFALGAFLAGLLISSTEFRFQALTEITPFRYCFNGLFFVAVGMIVNVSFVASNLSAVVSLAAFFMLAKIVVVGLIVILSGYPLSVALISGLMLAQVGEFSFLLVYFGMKSGTIGYDLYQQIIASSALTMMVAPIVVAAAPRIGEKLSSLLPSRKREIKLNDLPPLEEVLSNHAIICGFGPLGMTIGKLLEDQGIKYVILEINPATVIRERKVGRRIYLGDGSSSSLLHHSGIERARLMAIAVPDYMNSVAIIKKARQMNPNIYIISRGRYRDQCPSLYDAGADIVVCEELEAGIEMGKYVLAELGLKEADVAKIFEHVRSFGSADFF